MPLYEYRCPEGHLTTDLRKMADADALAVCSCGEPAKRIVSLPAIGKVVGSTTPVRAAAARTSGFVEASPGVWEKGSSIDADKIVDWRCTACPKKDVAVDEPVPSACPDCGAVTETYHNEAAQWKDWFPVGGYFDRGLGVYFHTRKERSDYAKAHGLQEAAGGYDDTEAALAARAREDKKVDDFWIEECRQAAAAGERDHVPQWIKDEVGWRD